MMSEGTVSGMFRRPSVSLPLVLSGMIVLIAGAALLCGTTDAEVSFLQVEGTELTYEFSNDANTSWEFDDGHVCAGKNVIHTFDGTGIHSVRCTSDGCTETISIPIFDEDRNIIPAHKGMMFTFCLEGLSGIDREFTDADFLQWDAERSRIVGTPDEEMEYNIRLMMNGVSERNTRTVIVDDGNGITVLETSDDVTFTYTVDGLKITLSALNTDVLSNEWKIFDSGMRKINSDRFKMSEEFTVPEPGRYLVSLTAVDDEGSTTCYQFVDVEAPSDDEMNEFPTALVAGIVIVAILGLLLFWKV